MNYRHGDCDTRFYSIWAGIKGRCNDKETLYFEKGIRVCSEWNEYLNFKKDMYESYIKHCLTEDEFNTTIDRIDNNKNYEPENCRWATCVEQAKNRGTNIWITYENETLCFSDWSKKLNIPRLTLLKRLEMGWTIEKAFSTLVKRGQRTKQETVALDNEIKTINEWSEITGLLPCTIRMRIRRGWSAKDALNNNKNIRRNN